MRLLLIGNRALLEDCTSEVGLSRAVTDALWAGLGRGVDADVVWDVRPVLSAMRGSVSSWRLWRYDAVVIVTRSAPAVSRRWWQFGLTSQLLRVVLEQVADPAQFVLAVVHRLDAGAQARDGWAGHRAGPAVTSVRLVGGEPATADVAALVERLVDLLRGRERTSESQRRSRELPDDEGARQDAVQALDLRQRALRARLQRVVELAREMCDTPVAEIAIVDGDRRWVLASTGEIPADIPRETSLCGRAIQRRSATVIGDTWMVPALRGNPLVDGLQPVRFYASHPIESVDGYRIGTLCVWDGVPRDSATVDTSALHDLALLAEAEIITADRS